MIEKGMIETNVTLNGVALVIPKNTIIDLEVPIDIELMARRKSEAMRDSLITYN